MIGIIGHGWLGKAIAHELTNQDFPFAVGVRSIENLDRLKNEGIACFLMYNHKVPDEISVKLSHLIICIPPIKTYPAEYGEMLTEMVSNIPVGCEVLFTSSTGIYPNEAITIDESFVFEQKEFETNSLLIAEQLLQNSLGTQLTILRLGGLVGKDRQLAKYVSGKPLVNPNSIVNLIEQRDVVRAIMFWYTVGFRSQIYNLVCPKQVTRAQYYGKACEILQIAPPLIDLDDKSKSKTVLGIKICSENEFRYHFESVMDFN
jgi:hypothetical protein